MVTMILLIDNLFDIYISELTEEIIPYDKNKDIQPPILVIQEKRQENNY
jgi:hypothetical protein